MIIEIVHEIENLKKKKFSIMKINNLNKTRYSFFKNND